MKRFIWDVNLENTLDSLLSIFPEVVRERWRQRICYNAEKIAAYQGKESINGDIFWQSVYEVLPLGYEPLILRHKDPERLQQEMRLREKSRSSSPAGGKIGKGLPRG
jgi:hypothetical protein